MYCLNPVPINIAFPWLMITIGSVVDDNGGRISDSLLLGRHVGLSGASSSGQTIQNTVAVKSGLLQCKVEDNKSAARDDQREPTHPAPSKGTISDEARKHRPKESTNGGRKHIDSQDRATLVLERDIGQRELIVSALLSDRANQALPMIDAIRQMIYEIPNPQEQDTSSTPALLDVAAVSAVIYNTRAADHILRHKILSEDVESESTNRRMVPASSSCVELMGSIVQYYLPCQIPISRRNRSINTRLYRAESQIYQDVNCPRFTAGEIEK
ncbi:hypothetical protein KCU73_g173, partial [Aureobasidium melanogenum]